MTSSLWDKHKRRGWCMFYEHIWIPGSALTVCGWLAQNGCAWRTCGCRLVNKVHWLPAHSEITGEPSCFHELKTSHSQVECCQPSALHRALMWQVTKGNWLVWFNLITSTLCRTSFNKICLWVPTSFFCLSCSFSLWIDTQVFHACKWKRNQVALI